MDPKWTPNGPQDSYHGPSMLYLVLPGTESGLEIRKFSDWSTLKLLTGQQGTLAGPTLI